MIDEKEKMINDANQLIQDIKASTASQKKVDQLNVRILEFTSYDHVDKLRTVFLPKFRDFGNKIDQFYENIERMETCVKQFDVVLNLKANKSQLLDYEYKVQSDFISIERWHKL